jgi:hypothetical protein
MTNMNRFRLSQGRGTAGGCWSGVGGGSYFMSSKRIAVITSVYGGFDALKVPAPQELDCDWIVVSDIPLSCPPWRPVVEPRPHMRPSMAAKVARACPEYYSDADVLIWVDGNVALKTGFLREAVAALGEAPLAAFDTSSERPGGVTQEAAIAARMSKYAGQPVVKQAASYCAAGMPYDWGSWWTGLRVQSQHCLPFGEAWLAEMARWSCECQISFPYVCWRAGVRPTALPADLRDLITTGPHGGY